MPDPKNPGDRAKAYRLRKALQRRENVADVDKLWLAEYEEKSAPPKGAAASKHHGRSRSGRRVSFELEEAAESEGTGNAAAVAAGAALAAKEEGRRLDALTINAVDSLKEACAVYKDICLTLRERTEILEATHIEMLQTVRGYYIHAMEAEGALIQRERDAANEGDPSTAMIVDLLSKHFGLDPKAAQLAAARAAAKRRPPLNGVAKP
jgi:hypothetical protein